MAHTIIINVSCHQGYHHHHHVISIMAEAHHQATITIINIMTPRHHQVISSKAPPSLSSRDQAIIKCINWTMGSTIKCNGSKPLARATSSTSIIKASISIIWDPPHHQGPHGTISAHHVFKHQSSCIVLWPLQGSPSGEKALIIIVVVIKDNHPSGVGINDNLQQQYFPRTNNFVNTSATCSSVGTNCSSTSRFCTISRT